jgi:hypothetical protein
MFSKQQDQSSKTSVQQNSTSVSGNGTAISLPAVPVLQQKNEAGNKGEVVQKRKLDVGEVDDGAAERGTASIFESSRITKGALFEKTVVTDANDPETVIAAYQEAITPIGENAREHTNTSEDLADAYTDKNIANPAGSLGKKPVSRAFMQTLCKTFLTDVAGLNALGFRTGMSADDARTLLGTFFGSETNITNNDNVGLVDPFIMRLAFNSKKKVKGENNWVLDTQFASTAAGYITRIKDGRNNITASITTPDEFAKSKTAEAEKRESGEVEDLIYSSTHEQGESAFGERVEGLDKYTATTDNRKATKKAAAANVRKRGSHAEAFDAVTWIAAEGARFNAVAEMGGAATPATNFYIPEKRGWRTVTLNWLMSHWGEVFKRKYGITNFTIAEEMRKHEYGEYVTEKPRKPAYNLKTGTMDT